MFFFAFTQIQHWNGLCDLLRLSSTKAYALQVNLSAVKLFVFKSYSPLNAEDDFPFQSLVNTSFCRGSAFR